MRRSLRALLGLVAVVAAAVLAVGLYERYGTDARSRIDAAQDEWERLGNHAVPIVGEGPTSEPIAAQDLEPGEHAARIIIDKIGLDANVVVGTSDGVLSEGIGLWEDGVLPGAPGNSTLVGHRTSHGAWFSRMDELEPGDRITVIVDGSPPTTFEVRGAAIVDPTEVGVTSQTDGVRLTLVTCESDGWRGTAHRLVVQAEAVSGPHADAATPADTWQFQR